MHLKQKKWTGKCLPQLKQILTEKYVNFVSLQDQRSRVFFMHLMRERWKVLSWNTIVVHKCNQIFVIYYKHNHVYIITIDAKYSWVFVFIFCRIFAELQSVNDCVLHVISSCIPTDPRPRRNKAGKRLACKSSLQLLRCLENKSDTCGSRALVDYVDTIKEQLQTRFISQPCAWSLPRGK